MNTVKKIKSKEAFIYVIVVILQILVVLYWAKAKTNYHVDELYSMGYASSLTGEGDKAWYITTNYDFGFDRWINNGLLKRNLILSEDEGVFSSSFGNVAKKFIFGRNYVCLLNLAESAFCDNYVSSRGSLLLNIILLILADIALISLFKKLHMETPVEWMAFIMFGFSGYIISAAEYVRFYMLIITMALIILDLFCVIWNSDKWSVIVTGEIGIIILAYLSYQNSELTIPFFGSLVICFTFLSYLAKKKKLSISLAGLDICGLIYLLVTTDFIGILFNPTKYLYLNNVWVSSSLNISNPSIGVIKEYMSWLRTLLETYYFGHVWAVYYLLGALTVCIIIASKKKIERKAVTDIFPIHHVTVFAFVVWVMILAISGFVGHGRAFSGGMLLIISVLGILDVFGHGIKQKILTMSSDTVFVSAILGEAIVYTVFEALCQHFLWRYYCFGFLSISVVLWYLADRLLKKTSLQIISSPVLAVLGVFVVLNAMIPFKTRAIENMYEDEKEFINNVNSNSNLDVVLISEMVGDAVSRHETYDCVSLMPEDTKLYVVDIANYEYNKVDYPNEFILWSYMDRDLDQVICDLEEHGYRVSELGFDHCSKAYKCSLE